MTMNSYSARLWLRWIVYPRSCVSAKSRTARSSSGEEVSVSAAAGNTETRPSRAPCQALNRSLMRWSPSSRSRAENRGVSLTACAIARVDTGPGTFSASRIPSAKTHRSPESASTPA